MKFEFDTLKETEFLFKGSAKIAPGLVDALKEALKRYLPKRRAKELNPRRIEEGAHYVVLRIAYEKHYPYPWATGFVLGEFEAVSVGSRYVTFYPIDVRPWSAIRMARPELIKVDSEAFTAFIID